MSPSIRRALLRARRVCYRTAIAGGYLAAAAGVVVFTLSFGLRYGILTAAVCVGLLVFALDGDVR